MSTLRFWRAQNRRLAAESSRQPDARADPESGVGAAEMAFDRLLGHERCLRDSRFVSPSPLDGTRATLLGSARSARSTRAARDTQARPLLADYWLQQVAHDAGGERPLKLTAFRPERQRRTAEKPSARTRPPVYDHFRNTLKHSGSARSRRASEVVATTWR